MSGHFSPLIVPPKWEIALCEPETAPGPGCQPTAIARYSTSCATVYRGACLGCGWIGPDRDSSNPAVEDAHDHTHPGWRELPVIEMPRRTADPRRDKRAISQVGLEVQRIYPPGWPQRCGPVRAWRDSPVASRHVPGYSPWGGYEMAVVRGCDVEPERLLEQLTLPV